MTTKRPVKIQIGDTVSKKLGYFKEKGGNDVSEQIFNYGIVMGVKGDFIQILSLDGKPSLMKYTEIDRVTLNDKNL